MKSLLRRCLPVLLALLFGACSAQNNNDYAIGKNDIADLDGQKIAVMSGSLQEIVVDKLCPQAEILRLNSASEVIASVASGQADFFLLDSTYIIGAHIEQRGLMVAFSTEQVAGDVAFGLNPKDSALCNELNEFLQRYRADGRWSQLNSRWTQGDAETVVMQHPQLNPHAPTLRVGTINFFPFSFIQNGRHAGFEAQLIEDFCAETGRNVEFLTIDFNGLIAACASCKIDVIAASMYITEERAKQILFSDPYYHSGTVCVARSTQAVEKKSFGTAIKESFHNNLIEDNRWKIIANGLWETVVISIFAILLGTIFGAFVCWMRMSQRKVLDGIAKVYVEIIRGVPILVLLMLMFYVIFAQSAISARWVAIIAFAMNFGAYVSEMFRSGIESVEKGQTEAGLAMGFTKLQTFIFFVVPQAAKRIIPIFKGEAVSLFKNTSVVGFIAIQDLTKASEIIRARTFDAFFPLIVISIIYFILAWLFGKLLDCLANKIA